MDANAKVLLVVLVVLVVQLGWNMEGMMAMLKRQRNEKNSKSMEDKKKRQKVQNLPGRNTDCVTCLEMEHMGVEVIIFDRNARAFRCDGIPFSLKYNDEAGNTCGTVVLKEGVRWYDSSDEGNGMKKAVENQKMSSKEFLSGGGLKAFVQSMGEKHRDVFYEVVERKKDTQWKIRQYRVLLQVEKAEFPFYPEYQPYLTTEGLLEDENYKLLMKELQDNEDNRISPQKRKQWNQRSRSIIIKGRRAS